MNSKKVHPKRLTVEYGKNFYDAVDVVVESFINITLEGNVDDWVLCSSKYRGTGKKGE